MDATPTADCLSLDYCGPHVPIPTAGRLGSWREGAVLALFHGSVFPPGCVRCGRPTATETRVRLTYLPRNMRWVGGFAFVVLGFARRVQFEMGLCPPCAARARESWRLGAYVLALGTVLAAHAAWRQSADDLVGATAAFIATAWLWKRARPVAVDSTDRHVIRLTGAAPEYLAPLPIGGPPGVGLNPDDLADRLAHVGEPVLGSASRGRRRRRRGRKRRRTAQAA